ncbi:MAG: hypothetical protein ACLFPA_03635 [Dichotomicrobium sp.]
MFVNYDPLLEGLGFAVLLGAVALDLYQFRRAELCYPGAAQRPRATS